MSDPIVLSVLSALCYGFWAVLQKQSSGYLLPQHVQLCTAITSAVFALIRWYWMSYSAGNLIDADVTNNNDNKTATQLLLVVPQDRTMLIGVFLAVASGLGSFTGTYFFTQAIGVGGDVGLVSAISATYPAMAYVVSLVMMAANRTSSWGEGNVTTTSAVVIEPHKIVGLLLAILSAVAFAYEPKMASAITTSNAPSSSASNSHLKAE